MKIKLNRLVLVFLVCVVINADRISSAVAGDIMIIANKDVPVENLTSDAVNRIFIGKIMTWKNGDTVTIAIQENDEVHKEFLTKFIKRSASQFERQWRMNMFTGKGRLPEKQKSDKELVAYVSLKKGAIGYVSSDFKLPEGIKVLSK